MALDPQENLIYTIRAKQHEIWTGGHTAALRPICLLSARGSRNCLDTQQLFPEIARCSGGCPSVPAAVQASCHSRPCCFEYDRQDTGLAECKEVLSCFCTTANANLVHRVFCKLTHRESTVAALERAHKIRQVVNCLMSCVVRAIITSICHLNISIAIMDIKFTCELVEEVRVSIATSARTFDRAIMIPACNIES